MSGVTAEPGVAGRWQALTAEIGRLAEAARRDPESVHVVAVSKTVTVDRIRDALGAGVKLLGENRVQEALPKIEALRGEDCRWHLVGHLQTNKVRFIEGNFDMVQSVDSIRLVEALDRRLRTKLPVLIEVNTGREPQKTGALPQDVSAIARACLGSQHLELRGLMTIAPLGDSPGAARPAFSGLRQIRDELEQGTGASLPELSMGMTDDYAVAIQEGATMLRLGRAIFGPRMM